MLRLTPSSAVIVAVLSFGLAVPAAARVMTFSKQSDTAAFVRDASDGNSAIGNLTSPQGKLLIGTGLVAADPLRDLVYVIANADPSGPTAGSPATLLINAYGNVPTPLGALDAPSGRYFTALVFDPAQSRLIGVVSDPTLLPMAIAQVFTVTTNSGTAIGMPNFIDANAGCCSFSAGIAAWRASTQELFMIGRRNGDTQDQLLRFNLAVSSPGPDAYPITDESVAALAVDGTNLYAIARSALNVSHLANVTYAAPGSPAVLTAIGAAPASCCYVAAGPATIDGTLPNRAMYALTRDAATPGPMRLSRFNLTTGAMDFVNAAMDGYGLWTDPSATLDRIFANGFD